MSLKQENFNEASKLDAVPCAQIQSIIRSLWDNTDTRIKLKDAEVNGSIIYFYLIKGNLSDVDEKCSYQGVERLSYKLNCQ